MNQKESINEKTKVKITITILIGLATIWIYVFLLNQGQNQAVLRQFSAEMASEIERLGGKYEYASGRHKYIQQAFDTIYEQDLSLLSQMTMSFFEESEIDCNQESLKAHREEIQDWLTKLGSSYFLFHMISIADREGNILASTCADEYPSFQGEEFDSLRETFETQRMSSLAILSEEDASVKYAEMEENFLLGEEAGALCNLYALSFGEDLEMVIGVLSKDRMALLADSDVWTVLLEHEIIGENGYALVWSGETGKILYFPDKSYKYQDVETLGMDMTKLSTQEYAFQTINGENMYMYPVYFQEQDVWIACVVSREEIFDTSSFATLLMGVLFALFCVALVYYVILLFRQRKIQVLTDFTGSGSLYAGQSRQYKLFYITVLFCVGLMLVAFYLQTLFLMSSWVQSSSSQTKRIQSTVVSNEAQAKSFISLYGKEKGVQLTGLAKYLSGREEQWTQEQLNMYSWTLKLNELWIMQEDGSNRVGLSSSDSSLSTGELKNEESINYSLEVQNQDQGKKMEDWMTDGRRELLTLSDETGIVKGYMYLSYYSQEADEALKSFSIPGTLEMVSPGRKGSVFAVDREDYSFTYYPDEDRIGEKALNYGLSEAQVKDNYCGYIDIDQVTYYATTDRLDENILFYVVPKTSLLSRRLPFTLAAVLLAFVLYLFTGILLYTSRVQLEVTTPEPERWTDKAANPSPEEGLMGLLKNYFALGTILVSIYTGLLEDSQPITVLGYVMEGNWEEGINVFAFTASLILLCKGGMILLLINRLVDRVKNIFSSRLRTMVKMISGLFTYVAIFLLVYQCTIYFGLKSTTIMASTGIVAVVLGIGANSLVGDILAGIFLLMEGAIQVGDVVQVGGFRGYVMEMGIRMTRLYDMDTEDVKIIPNNEVRNVVHMSMRRASVYSEYEIRYEEKLEDVEKLLIWELERVKDKSPLILEGPTYMGVSYLGENGVGLKIRTKCHEASRKKVEMEVNHIIYTIFQKNHIDVPYPQITVHEEEPICKRKGPGELL